MKLQLGAFWYESFIVHADGVMGYASQDVGPDTSIEGEVYMSTDLGRVTGYGFLVHDTDVGGDCIEGEYEAAVILLEELSGLRFEDDGRVVEGGQGVDADPTPVGELHVIAQADEWRVEADDDDQVHLIDGEGTLRASMPLEVWDGLVKSSSY